MEEAKSTKQREGLQDEEAQHLTSCGTLLVEGEEEGSSLFTREQRKEEKRKGRRR